ncbi:helix-turn-helix domain-containing protein [Paenibacillus sp. MMS18-CY102]|uniref:helix-turn-helix domain-containing protein n=1 Tax=Paenibacillus sp. MMS18-CY102 TaxID=2682849 RepID=UPI001F3C652B|nr:AraC family transcriptional regulator [Paenibacillus sp. MMS18-CY102]
MNKACELLTGTSLSVKEIAYSVGYSNQLHFTKMFKQSFGMSPSDFRKTVSHTPPGHHHRKMPIKIGQPKISG